MKIILIIKKGFIFDIHMHSCTLLKRVVVDCASSTSSLRKSHIDPIKTAPEKLHVALDMTDCMSEKSISKDLS